jgi:flagellar FliL protein
VADEDNEEGGSSRLAWLKPVLLIVGVLALVGAAIGGTLYFTGFFEKKPAVSIEQQLEDTRDEVLARGAGQGPGPAGALPGGAGAGAPMEGAPGGNAAARSKGGAAPDDPKPVPRKSPQMNRFEYAYMELPRELLVNISGSRKVMQVQVALMTRYDDRVFQNVKKHDFALRSAMLDVMRQVNEAQLTKPDFRKQLAESLRVEVNAVLEKFEDFGGVEEVYFTSFIVQ